MENVVNNQQVGLGFEMKQMLKLLGSSMYKGNESSVAVKELLQNSFDAVKTVENPRIDINAKPVERTLTVKDNGIGMSPETVTNVFLRIGGTLKDHLEVGDRSGGLGLAKVQFFMTAEKIYVRTVKDYVCTTLSCTQEELLTGTAELSYENVDEPNGTTVSLTFPEYVEDMMGKKKYIHFYSTMSNYSIMEYPLLLDGLQLYWNDKLVDMSIKPLYDTKLNFDADWGKMTIYICTNLFNKETYHNMRILSAGLFQFTETHYDCPLPMVIDIRPTVKAGDIGYPFNNTREGFNVSVSEDIDVMKKYLKDVYTLLKSNEIEKQFSALMDLDYMDPDKHLTPEERAALREQSPIKKIKDEAVAFESDVYAEIMTHYGHLAISGKKSYVEKEPVKLAASLAAQKEITYNGVSTIKFHNNTDGDYNIPGAREFFEDYASLIKKAIKEPEIRNKYKIMDDDQFVVGVSFDKTYSGVFLKSKINGIFLNPMSNDVDTMETFVGHFMHTLIHEIAHAKCDYHDEYFCREMATISLIMYRTGMYQLYEKFAKVIITRHEDTYRRLYDIYKPANPTSNNLHFSNEND